MPRLFLLRRKLVIATYCNNPGCEWLTVTMRSESGEAVQGMCGAKCLKCTVERRKIEKARASDADLAKPSE